MAGEANWYHAHEAPVKRSEGKSFVGLVAYITGQDLKDERTGTWCTRNHPGEVLGWGVTAPDAAPAWLLDKKLIAKITNAVEASETRVNSHVGEHWNIAGSREFSEEDHHEVAEQIAWKLSDRYKVLVIHGIHKPTDHGDDRNWHYHFGFNMRRLDQEGFGEKAREITAKATKFQEIKWVRAMVAEVINQRLELIGSQERVSHLSYAERGIKRTPTKHLGNEANQLELKGETTRIGDENREARQQNLETERAEQVRAASIARATAELEIIQAAILRRTLGTDMTEAEKADRERKQQVDEHLSLLNEEQLEKGNRFYRQIQIDKDEGDRQRKEGLDARVAEDGITDPRERYLEATKYYDMLRPERSLGDVAIAEAAAASREWHALDRQATLAEKQGNMDEATDIRFRRDIQHADYMQITTERLVGISEYVNPRGQQVESYRAGVEYWTLIAADLRSEMKDHRAMVELNQIDQLDQRIAQNMQPTRPEGVSDKYDPTPPDDGPGKRQDDEAWRVTPDGEVQQPGVHARFDRTTGQTTVRVEPTLSDKAEPVELTDKQRSQLEAATQQYHADQSAGRGQNQEMDHSQSRGGISY